MLNCSLIDRCIARCRNGLVRPASTSNTAANAASTSARSPWYSGCWTIQSAARLSIGVIGRPSRCLRQASQKNRLTSFWEGANIAELSLPSLPPSTTMIVTTEQLFEDARTQNGFLPDPVSDDTLRRIYELMKWG